ncbi:hypothetical protein [Hymenobacter properus]|uniref:Stress-induced protein n=1 Tax=Hymenobacter properus TaxID=2791026 RepID=A0A931BH28_9BACT|nr:hypothetical protein [Hymenobacter properus]MBF9141157.1 hypothetical protein [Hymenobacter properus]MBR7719966.1 hypothetical protein [Microvirga sp. SRT04]
MANNQKQRGGSSEQHAEAGRKGGEASNGGKSERGGGKEQHAEAGRRGGQASGGNR